MQGTNRVLNSRCGITNYLDGPFTNHLADDIRVGLTGKRKYIPSTYFYDANGSRLFDEICTLPEYYPTRTEISILERIAPGIIGPPGSLDLLEMGSGSEEKISALIRSSSRNQGEDIRYIPVDVSESALVKAGQCLTSQFSHIQVQGYVADFTRHLHHLPHAENTVFLLLGSTIGNFSPRWMHGLLQEVTRAMHPGDRFFLGIDMVKESATLEAAYNDSRGVTAEFNKNILTVVNDGLSADFDLDAFDHLAFFHREREQIEMHLVANRPVTVTFGTIPLEVHFERGESILTEISRKFRRENVESFIQSCGLETRSWHTDAREWFSLVELARKPG